jgi:hypothetical protein
MRVRTLKAVKSAFEANRDIKVSGRKISFVMIPFNDASVLEKRILKAKVRAVFIPEANDRSVRVILSVTRRLRLLSFTNMPNYVHWLGVTLGVDSSENQIRIMVSLAGCQHEKVEFDQKILGSAQVFF